MRPVEAGGFGLDAVWNDDLHHSAMVAVTGRNEAYYEDHQGVPQEFISAAKYGYLFQGQTYAHQRKPRGMAGLDLKPQAFVTFAQNHDQVANTGSGERLGRLTSPGRLRALTALLLLAMMGGVAAVSVGTLYGSAHAFVGLLYGLKAFTCMLVAGNRYFEGVMVVAPAAPWITRKTTS